MSKKEFVVAVKEAVEKEVGTNLTNKVAESFVDNLFKEIKNTLAKGESFSLIGFGAFKVIDRKARTGRNPLTGKEIKIPAKKAVKFVPGKELKGIVDCNKSCKKAKKK